MTTPTRKPTHTNRRSIHNTITPPATRSPTPSRDTTSSNHGTTLNGTGIGRRHTIREGPNGTPYVNGHASQGSISSLRNGVSARSAVKRPSISSGSTEELHEKVAMISDLKLKVQKLEAAADTAAREYADKMNSMQVRLDEAVEEATKFEEMVHVKGEVIEGLELQVKDMQRAKREQENIHDGERVAWHQEKEDMAEKEEELNATIQRLKENLALAQKERSIDETSSGRRSSADSGRDEGVQFAPPSSSASPTPPPARNTNNLLLQKDKIIQQLRLELAEAQIRVAEADHMGGSKVHELEQRLMEVRMANARLMEDNESFQLLLSTATLNGDFSRGDFMTNAFSDGPDGAEEEEKEEHDDDDERPHSRKSRRSPRGSVSGLGSSLAEELSEVAEEENAQEEAEAQRKLESEIKQLKDQNKALTCYINTIIERLLQHKDFETILDKTPSLGSIQASQAKESGAVEKALPPPPPPEEKPVNILNRARSMAARGPMGNGRIPINKPVPAIPQSEFEPEPLLRSQSMRVNPTGLRHKRSQSDTGGAYTRRAGNIVNPKGPPLRANTFFGSGSSTMSDGYTARPPRSRNSIASSVASSVSDEPSTPTHGGPVGMISGKTLRPLRLVQENVGGGALKSPILDHDEEKKKTKRGSWMGWFNRGKEEPEIATSTVVFERKDVE